MRSKPDANLLPDHSVEVWEEVRTEDVVRLDPAARRAAAEVVAKLYTDPFLGDETASEHVIALPGCRKVRFDAPDEKGRPRVKPRYRLIYKNEPTDGSVAVVAIIASGERNNLIAYRIARSRLDKRDGPDELDALREEWR